jgi:uncharacterized repeat protein (TIGR03803 family)
MRHWNLSHSALASCVAASVFAGCGGSQPLVGAPGAMQQFSALATRSTSTNYKVLYSFGAPPDESRPEARLIDVRGTLYGTTEDGGAYNEGGTVFTITTGGAEKVLHSFGAPPDGSGPQANLIDVHGTLYGTTLKGGAYHSGFECSDGGCGTVFSITPSGEEKVLHSFGGIFDDGNPDAGLIDVKGTLYGTTEGGCYPGGGCGTVYSITTQGEEKVLHIFGAHRDGALPEAGLIDVKGKLYGTTTRGGAHHGGTVFRVTLDGKEKVLHSFGKGTDGSVPSAGLIDVRGTLYGTTEAGGAYGSGYGTVFSITLGGKEEVLHSFNGTDGRGPQASLIDVNGTLYGTTKYGGTYNDGTVFSIGTSGTVTVLHSFGGSGQSDGQSPLASLTDVNGTLYGTTESGGTDDWGTVFALTP